METTERWVSFCISTYKRPGFLKDQIGLLLKQEDANFEIVISDNDPEASGAAVAEAFNDDRVRYFHNADNLGMIRSFNKSIERARTPFICMVTDDDPVEPAFLRSVKPLKEQYPGHSLYAGFRRTGKAEGATEVVAKDIFLEELLDPDKTPEMLWSSCILNREHALKAGAIPDYGSPHLADHALLVLTGSVAGGVVTNRTFSSLNVHETNFSKSNFATYVQGCKGFYEVLTRFLQQRGNAERGLAAIMKHLKFWFVPGMFNLKKFFVQKGDRVKLNEVNECARQILAFPFMRELRPAYRRKAIAFEIKKMLGLIKKT